MLRVGLTGGIGSGKSAVAAMLRARGARVSHSDEVGRDLMNPGQPAFLAIVSCFGPNVLRADGSLDRAVLARIAFAEHRVEELNGIVHPLVIDAQAAWMASVAEEDGCAVAVVESALIFETRHGETKHGKPTGKDPAPWRTRFDRIVVVTAPEAVRRTRYIARVAAARGASAADAPAELAADVAADVAADFNRRAATQWTDERKAAVADVVLRNDGSLADLETKVGALFAALKQESEDRAAESM